MSIHDKFYEIVTNGISDSIINELNPITESEILSQLESSRQIIQLMFPKHTKTELYSKPEEDKTYSKLEVKILVQVIFKNILVNILKF